MNTINSAKVNELGRKAAEAVTKFVRCRLSWNWPGARRAVKGELANLACAALESDARSTSTSTAVYDWSHPALSALRSLKNEVRALWEKSTLPYVEDGVRLLRKDGVEVFEAKMGEHAKELTRLAVEVQSARAEIIAEARVRRGKAFNLGDYPADLSSLFGLSWSYDVLTVPEALREVGGGAYAAEQARHAARLLGAVQLAEEAMMGELAGLLDRLSGQLAPPVGNERKPVTTAAVEGLRELCSTFAMSLGWGADDLEDIAQEAGEAIAGVELNELRRNWQRRGEVREKLLAVRARIGEPVEGPSEGAATVPVEEPIGEAALVA